MYNPYLAALAALTNEDAKRFYFVTAIEHTDAVIEAAHNCYLAGRAARKFHDQAIVPFTLMAVATVIEFFVKPEVCTAEIVEQPLLAGFTSTALLPEAKPRALITPCVTESRTLVTPAPVTEIESLFEEIVDSGVSLEALVQVALEGEPENFDPLFDFDGSEFYEFDEVAPEIDPDTYDGSEIETLVFETLGIRDLRKMAKERGIKNASRMTKSQLVEQLAA